MGATGFVGGHVVEYLFQQNEISKGVFRKGAFLKTMDLNGVQGVEGDLLDHHSLHEAMEGADVVYSMASPAPGEEGALRLAAEGIPSLLEVARESKVKALVHLSTLDVYGFAAGRVTAASQPKPSGEYQEAKFLADRTLLEFAKREREPRIVLIRAARALGSRDQSLAVPLLRMVQEGSVTIPARQTMSFTHPKDIAQAMLLAATKEVPSGAVFLVKSFDAAPQEVVTTVAGLLDREVKVRNQGLFSKGVLPQYTSEQLKGALSIEPQPEWATLGYSPQFDLAKTCEELVAWYRKEPWAVGNA